MEGMGWTTWVGFETDIIKVWTNPSGDAEFRKASVADAWPEICYDWRLVEYHLLAIFAATYFGSRAFQRPL